MRYGKESLKKAGTLSKRQGEEESLPRAKGGAKSPQLTLGTETHEIGPCSQHAWRQKETGDSKSCQAHPTGAPIPEALC